MHLAHSNLTRVAELVRRYLKSQKQQAPKLSLIQRFIEIAFYASMKSEEARPIVCTLAFVKSHNPSGPNPPRVRPQRRSYLPFGTPIPFDIRNLVKLSQAAPPWGSCIGVCGGGADLVICGLFD